MTSVQRTSVRRAQAEDIASMATLLIEGFQLVPPPLMALQGMVRAGLQSDLQFRMAQPKQYRAFVAIDAQQQVVGTVELQMQMGLFPWDNGIPYAYLSNLAVDPWVRRSGVAQSLLASCEQQVRSWGEKNVFLHVMAENTSARRLYLQAGYRCQSSGESLNLNNGKVEVRLFLHRRL